YIRVRLNAGERWQTICVHRLVAAAFIGPCPEGCEVNHKDLNKANNSVGNLEYITHAENVKHARQNKKDWRSLRGENSSRGKLTNAQADEIRNSPLSQRVLGRSEE